MHRTRSMVFRRSSPASRLRAANDIRHVDWKVVRALGAFSSASNTSWKQPGPLVLLGDASESDRYGRERLEILTMPVAAPPARRCLPCQTRASP